jgi:hypothetical protein
MVGSWGGGVGGGGDPHGTGRARYYTQLYPDTAQGPVQEDEPFIGRKCFPAAKPLR